MKCPKVVKKGHVGEVNKVNEDKTQGEKNLQTGNSRDTGNTVVNIRDLTLENQTSNNV